MNLMQAEVCFIIGTRAQLVKMAPVITAADQAGVQYCVWFTGQHAESMPELLEDFGLRIDERYFGRFGEQDTVGSLVRWVPSAFLDCQKFMRKLRGAGSKATVVVHGDTLSALLGALAGWWAGLRVAHVESGLSSGRAFSPFPEELIRRIIFRFTDIAYCPNAVATERMRSIGRVRAVNTKDNTIVDSIRRVLAQKKEGNDKSITGWGGQYLVFSVHRFENIFDRKRLARFVAQLLRVAARHEVWFVLHPATRRRLEEQNLLKLLSSNSAIHLVPRMPYTKFVILMAGASAVVTDGGSNQEELSYLGIPTILLREQSERPDGLGRNIVLEAELDYPFDDYLLFNEHEKLRCAMVLGEAGQPSQHIVADLKHGDKGTAA